MQFKHKHIVDELSRAPLLLKIILMDADHYCQDRFNKQLLLTRILDPVSGESGVHKDYRAADCRDFFNGVHMFTEKERELLLTYINEKYSRNDGFKTLVHHSFKGGPELFHFQIALSTKAYMPK